MNEESFFMNPDLDYSLYILMVMRFRDITAGVESGLHGNRKLAGKESVAHAASLVEIAGNNPFVKIAAVLKSGCRCMR